MSFVKAKKRDSNHKFEFAQGHSVLPIIRWIRLKKIWHQWMEFHHAHLTEYIYEQERQLNTPESPN